MIKHVSIKQNKIVSKKKKETGSSNMPCKIKQRSLEYWQN